MRPRASGPSSPASTSGAGDTQQPGSIGASSGASEERRENFISRVMKPLQDFGFGKMSFMEGGVGLFVFAGVGAVQAGSLLHSMLQPRWNYGTQFMFLLPMQVHEFLNLTSKQCCAGLAIVLISWARGGQLGRRGKGYQVRGINPVNKNLHKFESTQLFHCKLLMDTSAITHEAAD